MKEDVVAKRMRTLHYPEYLYAGRFKGKVAYDSWKTQLLKTAAGEALWLSFPEGQLVEPSFAEESIIRLGVEINRKEFGKRCLRLRGLTEDSIININAIIKWHDHEVAFIARDPRGEFQLLGRTLGKDISAVFDSVKERGSMTSAGLASGDEIKTNAASNQLMRLHKLRLLRRKKELTRKGLEYVYSVWV